MDLYDAIYKRRDIRHFKSDSVEDKILEKILMAAHHAGSVGFMQPWHFIVIRSLTTKKAVQRIFQDANEKARLMYEKEDRTLYDSLKLEGITEAPINIAVTCHHQDIDAQRPTLGRQSMPEMDLYSTCCAIQNLWLAARAEEIGLGWVSIIDPFKVKKLLEIPDAVTLVAYLCLGYPQTFEDTPLLQKVGWRQRLPLENVVFKEKWNLSG